jgi:hypothetical protein
MNTNERTPEAAAAADTSNAIFSLVENSKNIPAFSANFSRLFPISEDGVPGYVDAYFTPASIKPLVIASFPNNSSLPSFAIRSAIRPLRYWPDIPCSLYLLWREPGALQISVRIHMPMFEIISYRRTNFWQNTTF